MCPWRKPIRPVLALLGVGALATRLPAQTGEPSSAMPVEVRADPEVTGPKQPVRLLGSTPVVAGIEHVKLTIDPPEGLPSSLTAVVDPNGSYAVTFSATKATGTYQVRALAPDRKGSATAAFRVFDPASSADDFVDAAEDLLEAAESAARTARDLVATLPVSPAQLEVLDRLRC